MTRTLSILLLFITCTLQAFTPANSADYVGGDAAPELRGKQKVLLLIIRRGEEGRYFDQETGLHYFRARYFDSALNTFISRDPLGYVDGQSMYVGYFSQWMWTDPSGEKASKVTVNRQKDVWPGIDAYIPDKPNTNDCDKKEWRNVDILEKRNYPDNGFCAKAEGRWTKALRYSSPDEFDKLKVGGKIKKLMLAAHGYKNLRGGSISAGGIPTGMNNPLNQRVNESDEAFKARKEDNLKQLAEAYFLSDENLNTWGKKFHRKNFCKKCEIWLLACNGSLFENKMAQRLANYSGCIVYAHNRSPRTYLKPLLDPWGRGKLPAAKVKTPVKGSTK